MGGWATTADAILDLRRFLNDGPQDRSVKSKKVVGPTDGVNAEFFTFEDRLVVPSAGPTVRVTSNYTAIPDGDVTVDDVVLGQFTIATPSVPVASADVRASYYYQYFLDDELDEALKLGSEQIFESDDYINVETGLKMATLAFAGHWAYTKQAMRWAERMSNKFLLEDDPLQAEVLARSNMFQNIASKLLDNAIKLRDSFYTRNGRRNAPAFRVYKPHIPSIGPRS